MSSKRVDHQMINRFLSNKSTAQEANEVADYLAANLHVLDNITLFETLTDDEVIASSMAEKDRVYQHIVSHHPDRAIWWRKWVAAACLIGLLSIATHQWLSLRGLHTGTEIAGVPSMIRIENFAAFDSIHYLPDSSSALLTSGSRVEYAALFGIDRVVHQLAGEVYYGVRKDTLHPFRVIANGITTTAIGTEFWVKNHPDNPQIAITLVSGKIKLSSADETFLMDDIYLDPGQQCLIDKVTGKISISSSYVPGKAAPALAPGAVTPKSEAGILWTNREIRFNKVQLNSVFARLAAQYNVSFQYVDVDLESALITGKIFYSDSLNTILESICEINQLQFERNQDTIYVRRK